MEVKDKCWSENTHKARASQWRRYFSFCDEFNLVALPADVETVGLYITFLARKVCYVTIINYISGLWALHDYWGIPHVDPQIFLIRATLKGAKRLLGCESVQVDPLSPSELKLIFNHLNLDVWRDLQFWCAVCLMYRCLLRVGHIVASPHTMLVRDIKWTQGGMDVIIRSSKTIQFRQRTVTVPVWAAGGSVLCPCGYLRKYLARPGLHVDSPLFPYTYQEFSARLKKLCVQAGLPGRYGTHSLRRGSATFLSSFLPLHDVKTYGDWRSWAVLLYISDNYSTRKMKDTMVAEKLSYYV